MGSGNKRRFSYTDQKLRQGKIMRVLGIALLVFLGYEALTGIFLRSRVVSSEAMAPNLQPGDHILVSPLVYGLPLPILKMRLPGILKPKRGDLVIVSPPFAKSQGFPASFFNALLRVVSFQRLGGQDATQLKRIVGLPGDMIELKDSLALVRPGGQGRALTEFELAKKPYEILKGKLPEGWPEDAPFSGAGGSYQLGPNEFFLLNDNRGLTSDSRSWGLVGEERILARVLLRYWPLLRP